VRGEDEEEADGEGEDEDGAAMGPDVALSPSPDNRWRVKTRRSVKRSESRSAAPSRIPGQRLPRRPSCAQRAREGTRGGIRAAWLGARATSRR